MLVLLLYHCPSRLRPSFRFVSSFSSDVLMVCASAACFSQLHHPDHRSPATALLRRMISPQSSQKCNIPFVFAQKTQKMHKYSRKCTKPGERHRPPDSHISPDSQIVFPPAFPILRKCFFPRTESGTKITAFTIDLGLPGTKFFQKKSPSGKVPAPISAVFRPALGIIMTAHAKRAAPAHRPWAPPTGSPRAWTAPF